MEGNNGARAMETFVEAETPALQVVRSTSGESAGSVTAPGGASAQLQGGGLEIRDPDDRLVFRYVDGNAEVYAPAGDISFCAPTGRIRLESGTDVEIEAQRDVVQRPHRSAKVWAGDESQPQLDVSASRCALRSDELDVQAKRSQLASGQVTVLARSIATTARSMASNVERYELTAQRLVEKSRDAFREVTDLLQTRAGRARTLVRGAFALHSRRTVMMSKKDTTIDGQRILLG